MSDNLYMSPTRIVTTTTIHSAACYLASILVGTDGVSDPVVAVYNNTSAVDTTRIIPSVTYDASALGLNGVVMEFLTKCTTGLHVVVSNLGSGEVIINSRLASDMSKYAVR